MELYLKTKTGANAIGEYNPVTKTMVVRAGSTVAFGMHKDGEFRCSKSISRYRELYCTGVKIKQDVVFTSASTAANFVLGHNSNGLIKWKDSDGATLKSLLSED